MEERDNIVTLTNSKGENVEFIELASISLPHGFYTILKPKEKIEGLSENDAIVFKVIENIEDSTQSYELVIDEEILEEVFEEYNNSKEEE